VRAVCRVGARVVAVTDGKDRIRVAQCLEAGAYAAVSTHEPVDRLLSAVRETVAGRRSVPNPADADLLGELQGFRRDRAALLARFAQLSTRESEVLEELMRGKAPAEIATSSYVSIATIRSQIKAILRKLEVNSQLAAVALAYQLGWSRNAFKANGGQARGHDLPTLPR
jgi:two-component system nitrate/nitrite response regulator NarL